MKTWMALAAGGMVTAAAQADWVGGPIEAPIDGFASVRFVSASAGWTGELSWLGTAENKVEPLLLMSNRASASDPAVWLGAVSAGDSLFFQYEVKTGTKNVFRMDENDGLKQFRHQWLDGSTARLFVEDIRLPGGDEDYNDAVYDVRFTPVPAPGAAGVLALGACAVSRRRRPA